MRKISLVVLLLAGCSSNPGLMKGVAPVAYENEQTRVKLEQCRKEFDAIPVDVGSSAKLDKLKNRGCLELHINDSSIFYDYTSFKRDIGDFTSAFYDKSKKVDSLLKESAQREVDFRRTRLLAGTERIQSLQDAKLVYEHESVEPVMGSPLIKPDGKIYAGVVTLDAQEDDKMLRGKLVTGFVDSPNVYYVFIRTGPNSTIFHPDKLRIGGYISVMGRYVENTKYRTVSGTEKLAPVLDAMFIE